MVPIVKGNRPIGVISIVDLLKKMGTGTWLKGTDPLVRAIDKDFVRIKPGMSIDAVSRLVATSRFAFILDGAGNVKVENGRIWTVNPVALLKAQNRSKSEN